MTIIEAFTQEPYLRGRQLYVRAPRPIEFPTEEEVPETKRHLEARTTLYLLLKEAFAAGTAIGSEQFVYWDAGDPQKCLSPDIFVKGGAPDHGFDTWKIWERGAPDLAVEIVSASDRRDADWADKLARYQSSGIGEVVRFDAEGKQPLRVWDRVDGELVERAAASTALFECVALHLWWVVLPSEYGPMLRLARDPEGKILLATPDEDRLRLADEAAEARRARSLAEHERMLAQHAQAVAERARAEAESARAAAEAKSAAAEAKSAAAEAENERLRAELARLRGGR